MTRIEEHWSSFPFTTAPRILKREEDALLRTPPPGFKKPMVHDPLQVVHFTPVFEPGSFAIPRPVFESNYLRVEWQTMPGSRQPFYHRNTDVDELSFQVAGDRSLITDVGLAQLHPGDFTRMPPGVTHDNFSNDDIHILFYSPGGVKELVSAYRRSEIVIPPQSWEAEERPELVTECLGGPEHDITMNVLHENDIWNHAYETDERLDILRVDSSVTGTTWLYESPNIVIGQTTLIDDPGLVYLRRHNCDEIQYQVSGERFLVSQRGMVRVVAGDFVRIPLGVAYTSIVKGTSTHLSVCSATTYEQVIDGVRCVRASVPQIAESTGEADPVNLAIVELERAK